MCFIENITREEIENNPFPIKQLLKNSLYYPACGLDGGIIKFCNTAGKNLNIKSFVYCDYGIGEESFKENQNTFHGYHVLGTRNIKKEELIPNGWEQQIPTTLNLNNYFRYQDSWKPFVNWTIYQRNPDVKENHGPKKFSLLYIGGEGVATYQALYWSNQIAAKALAIIRPGTGFGGNWTDFTTGYNELEWVIENNPVGNPRFIFASSLDWRNYMKLYDIDYFFEGNLGNLSIFNRIENIL